MTSTAGRSGSVQTSRRSSPAPSRRSGRSSRTQTARTTRPLRKRAATRQLRYRATSSLPYRIRALRWTGSASTRSGVIRGPYLRGRPRRRRRGGRGTAYSARSREPVVAGPAPRQPGGQDRVGDVTAPGDGGPDQQLGEGGAGAPRYGLGEAVDERGQDGRDGDGGRGGHRSSQRGEWRGVTP